MDQLVKEESQKLLTKQMEQARLQRRIQVRQQALAWTEATRKKFELAKEREIKKLANQVTEQAQQTAIERIQHLTELHDLAMAEIGMAHRAAAGIKEVEKLKSLKRLKNEEVAKNRGTSAMMKLSRERQLASAKTSEILNRKKEVRRLEDMKSQEVISRRPLALTNPNGDARSSKTNLGPPEYQQSLAKTLHTALRTSASDRKSSKTSFSQSQASRKSSDKMPLRTARSSDEKLRSNKEVKSHQGVLEKMVRIRTSEQQELHRSRSLTKTRSMDKFSQLLYMRSKYMDSQTPPMTQAPTNAVRYYDTAVPKREVKYIQPEGLSVKENRSSPDAWEKGKLLSEQLLKEQEERTQRQEELGQKQKERSVQAILEERLSKQKLNLENQLKDIIDPEHQPLDIGSQRGIFELGSGVEYGIRNRTSSSMNLRSSSSDKLLTDEADQRFFLSQSLSSDSVHGPIASSNLKTLEKVRLEPKLKVLSEQIILKKRLKKQQMALENQLKDPEHQSLGAGTSRDVFEPEASGKYRTRNLTSSAEELETKSSDDEFVTVESDEDFIFPGGKISSDSEVLNSSSIEKTHHVHFKNQQKGLRKQGTLEEQEKKQNENQVEDIKDPGHQPLDIGSQVPSGKYGTQNLTSSAEDLETNSSSDEFSAVESDEEYSFAEIISSASGSDHGPVPSSGTHRKDDFEDKQRDRNKQVALEERRKQQKVDLKNQARDPKHKSVNIMTSQSTPDHGEGIIASSNAGTIREEQVELKQKARSKQEMLEERAKKQKVDLENQGRDLKHTSKSVNIATSQVTSGHGHDLTTSSNAETLRKEQKVRSTQVMLEERAKKQKVDTKNQTKDTIDPEQQRLGIGTSQGVLESEASTSSKYRTQNLTPSVQLETKSASKKLLRHESDKQFSQKIIPSDSAHGSIASSSVKPPQKGRLDPKVKERSEEALEKRPKKQKIDTANQGKDPEQKSLKIGTSQGTSELGHGLSSSNAGTLRKEHVEHKPKGRSKQAMFEEPAKKQKVDFKNQTKDTIDPEHWSLGIGTSPGVLEPEASGKYRIQNLTSSAEDLETSDEFSAVESDEEFIFPGGKISSDSEVLYSSSIEKTHPVHFKNEQRGRTLEKRGKKQEVNFENQTEDLKNKSVGIGTSQGSSDIGTSQAQGSSKLEAGKEHGTQTSSNVGTSTEYFSPPAEGPFHSTPDGKLLHHKRKSKPKDMDPEEKKQILSQIVEKFLKRRPESIEKMCGDPSMTTSRLQVESDLLAPTPSGTPSRIEDCEEYYRQIAALSARSGSSGSEESGSREGSLDETKRRALTNLLNKFLDRRPESIEKLPVKVSSGSIVEADSELASGSGSATLFRKSSDDSFSSSNGYRKSRSGVNIHKDNRSIDDIHKDMPTLLEDPNEDESESTLTAVKHIVPLDQSRTVGSSDKSGRSSSKLSSGPGSPTLFRRSSAESGTSGKATPPEDSNEDDSGSTLTAVKRIVPLDQSSIIGSSEKSATSSSKNDSNGSHQTSGTTAQGDSSVDNETGSTVTAVTHTVPFGRNGSSSGSSSQRHNDSSLRDNTSDPLITSSERSSLSNDTDSSFPDAEKALERIIERGRRPLSRISSESSPKSGPERETDRAELLEEMTPVRLMETPSRENLIVKNETDELSVIFDNLIDKWMNVRISPPPWFSQIS